MKRESYQRGSLTRVHRKLRPDVWRLRYYDYDLFGHRVQRSVTIASIEECPTRAKAELKADPMRQKLNSAAACVYFRDLAERYKLDGLPQRASTRSGYLPVIQRLSTRWNDTRLDWMCAHPGDIERWLKGIETLPRDGQPARPLGNQTRANIRAILHRMFEMGIKWGLIELQRNPIDLVELRNLPRHLRRVRVHPVLTVKQVRDLMEDPLLPLYVRVMVQVAACTGLRISEVLGLRWEDIDFAGCSMHVRRSAVGAHIDTPKTAASAARIPMDAGLAAALADWSRAQPSVNGWLFGSIRTGRPFVRTSLQAEYLAPAGRRMGLPTLGWHTFRHTYRAMLRELDLPPELQRDLMRHTTIAMTERYGRESDLPGNQLRKAASRVVEIFSIANAAEGA